MDRVGKVVNSALISPSSTTVNPCLVNGLLQDTCPDPRYCLPEPHPAPGRSPGSHNPAEKSIQQVHLEENNEDIGIVDQENHETIRTSRSNSPWGNPSSSAPLL